MPRRHYLLTYDVSDDKRRTRLFKLLEGNGDHVQYSVFFCELNEQELVQLRSGVGELIEHDQDQVLFLDLGSEEMPLATALQCVGRKYEPPCRIQIV